MNKINELVNQLIEAKEAYYNDEPILDDEKFDELEDELRILDPDNDYFSIVGIPVQGGKVKHKYPMLSAAKVKSVKGVEIWLNKILDNRVELILEPKIDGLSASIVYENGKLQYISTRGDGIEGRIVSHLKDYLNIPKIIPLTSRFEVRGEIFLSKNTQFPNPENKPLRNLASGLTNRKDSGLNDLKYLKFIAYQLIEDIDASIDKESIKIDYLSTLGFKIIPYKIVASIQEINDYFEEYKSKLRELWDFETDGLIICVNDNKLHEEIDSKYVVDHHHHYNLAIKPPSESKWTTITGITWQISKNGNIVPVVNITPIIIGGSTIQNVTANNYENVKKLKLNIGDKIHVSKANDVIPFLIETVPTKDKSELIPTHCPFCNSTLIKNGVHLQCINSSCSEKNIQLITHWAKSNNMDDVSEATIRLLYNENYIRYITDLYELKDKKNELIELERLGDRSVDNLLKQIEKSRNINIIQFISRLSISLVGEKAVKKLKIKSIDDFWNFTDKTYKIGQNFIEFKENNKYFLVDLIEHLNISNIKEDTLSKGNVCMTGKGPKGRKELIKEIEDKGYTFIDGITKETDILICEDTNGNSSKLQKAKKLGIKLISYEEFFK
jgi:DNA ligase (NAD+)